MRYDPFELERWASTYEHRVRFNLSESGVDPLTAHELISMAGHDPADVLGTQIGYGQSNGTDLLRERIAALYPGANEANVLVTIGGIEANFTAMWHFLTPGEAAAVMLPNYMQVPGLLSSFGARVMPYRLLEEDAWQPDLDELKQRLEAGARFILVTNPNNPTGSVLRDEARRGIIDLADEHGAWILADEVYSGAELFGETPTPTFWGQYDRVVATNSLSKAYGLPGLRLGWIVAPEELMEDLWGRKDYTSISPAILSDALARIALDPETRPKILDRTRTIVRDNFAVVERWMAGQPGRFRCSPPAAGAICFPRYAVEVGSVELAEKLRVEQDVLIIPGVHFGVEHFMRIGFGPPAKLLMEGLEGLKAALDSVESVGVA